MALKIRLRRVGAKKQPAYRIVIADARAPRDGRFIEIVGHYNPLTDPATVVINADRALYWLHNGAQPTEVVQAMMVRKGIWAVFTGAAPLESLQVVVPEPTPAPAPVAEPEPEPVVATESEPEPEPIVETPAAEEGATAEEAVEAEATAEGETSAE